MNFKRLFFTLLLLPFMTGASAALIVVPVGSSIPLGWTSYDMNGDGWGEFALLREHNPETGGGQVALNAVGGWSFVTTEISPGTLVGPGGVIPDGPGGAILQRDDFGNLAGLLPPGIRTFGIAFPDSTQGFMTLYGWLTVESALGEHVSLTLIEYGYEDSGLAVVVGGGASAVPLPGTLALLLGGFFAAGWLGSRRVVC